MTAAPGRLAPLYGVASAALLDERDRSPWEMAMQIDGEGRFSSLTGERWRRFCSRAGVPFELVADTARQYAAGLGDALTDAGRGLPASARPYVSHLVDRVVSHAAAVVRMLQSTV